MKPLYTFGMLLLLIVMGGYVFFFEREPLDPQAKNPVEQFNILEADFAQIDEVQISQNAPAKEITLKRVNDVWQLADGQPADRSRVESALRQITPWQASSRLMESFNAEQARNFGLETPDLIVRVKLGEQSEVLKVGNKTPTNSGYYVLHEGDSALYLSFVNVPEELKKLVNEPPLPSPSPEAQASPAADS